MTTSTTRSNDHADPTWVDDVIRFWFEELTARDWFVKSDQVDDQIRSRFLALHQKLAGQPSAPAGPRATLATVIVLDQFSRNLFRNSAQAFAADAMALQIARDAVARGLDQALPHNQRLFLYLPFEHSENTADQELSLRLISGLGDAELTRYAVAHKAIIDRFGRFAHRNSVLGRPSTDEELAFLKQPNSSF